jgi:hypothetical protein
MSRPISLLARFNLCFCNQYKHSYKLGTIAEKRYFQVSFLVLSHIFVRTYELAIFLVYITMKSMRKVPEKYHEEF